MFHNTSKIENLTAEALVNIASFLSISSILQLSLTCKNMSHLIKDELVFRQLNKRDFVENDLVANQSWLDLYKKNMMDTDSTTPTENQQVKQETAESEDRPLPTNPVESTKVEQEDTVMKDTVVDQTPLTDNHCCPHLKPMTDTIYEIKRVLYSSQVPALCDICLTNSAAFLNMHPENHSKVCLSCLKLPVEDDNHYPIQLELQVGDLYCIECENRNLYKLTEEKDGETVKKIQEYIKSEEDIDTRRKAEHYLYIQELRREDMTLMYYFVEKQWGRNWMLFRTREGSPLPSKITNNKLARSNGTLDPNIRLPMDKYRPSPETHADIISEKLWSYLSKAYGVQGRAYNEDDIISPEYARLRVYVDDFKKSIHLYP